MAAKSRKLVLDGGSRELHGLKLIQARIIFNYRKDVRFVQKWMRQLRRSKQGGGKCPGPTGRRRVVRARYHWLETDIYNSSRKFSRKRNSALKNALRPNIRHSTNRKSCLPSDWGRSTFEMYHQVHVRRVIVSKFPDPFSKFTVNN